MPVGSSSGPRRCRKNLPAPRIRLIGCLRITLGYPECSLALPAVRRSARKSPSRGGGESCLPFCTGSSRVMR